LEDLAAVSSAARALADRYGGTEHAEVPDALLAALRDAATDYVSATDLPVPLLLLRVLDSGVPSSP
jgi:hypothetical protein